MDTRDPLEVRWEEAWTAGDSPPTDRTPIRAKTQPWTYPTDPRRATLYYLEYHRAANNGLLRDVDRDMFLQELGEGTAPSKELLQATVRAFLCAAFRLPGAQTTDGWRKVMAVFSAMLGTAMQLGYAEARPIVPGKKPVPRIPKTPPLPPWAIIGYESRRPNPQELEADLAYWKGLPVRLVETLIRAYLNARCRSDEGATPEGRSRIMAATRESIWDAVLDAVKRHPCPQPTPRPAPNSPRPKRLVP
jgi:hypothetical protein